MGKLINGINGPFIGTVGTVIGSSRRGISYMKGPYKARTTNISKDEVLNRNKFAAAQAWLKPLVDVVRVGFKNYSAKSQGFVSAKSYLYKNALSAVGDTVIIEPDKVRISFGNLPMSANVEFSITGAHELTFTWDPEPPGTDHSKDQVLMVAYNIKDKTIAFSLTGQFRSVGKDILPLSQNWKPGAVLHVYIAFTAADRSRQSDSRYLGEITI